MTDVVERLHGIRCELQTDILRQSWIPVIDDAIELLNACRQLLAPSIYGARRDLGYRSDASGVPVVTRERALPGFDKPEPEMPRRRLEELSEKPIG